MICVSTRTSNHITRPGPPRPILSALDMLASALAAEIQLAGFHTGPSHMLPFLLFVSQIQCHLRSLSSPEASPPLCLPPCVPIPGTQPCLADLFMACLHLFPSTGTCSPCLPSAQNSTWHTPHPRRRLLSSGIGTTTRGAAGRHQAKGKMTPALPSLSPGPGAGKEGCVPLG